MKNGSGTTGKAASAAVTAHGGRAPALGTTAVPTPLSLDGTVGAHGGVTEGKATAEDKNVDAFEFGVSMGIGRER